MSTSRLHFMGIGGQGISAVAQMAQAAGETVTGCDQRASATTDAMQRAGIPVTIGHSPAHLHEADTLVISPAVPALDPNNVELLAAQQQGKRVITWQELLGELMQDKCVLSVSGVHGKGTTTAMLSLMLVDAGLDPTCEIGAIVPRFDANYRLGKSVYFVNEADEFNHNFWHYHPRLVIVTSIEFEHPEFFADYTAFLDAFEHFIRGMDIQREWPLPPTLILNADSPGCLDLQQRLSDWQGQMLWYSVAASESIAEGEDPWDAYIKAHKVTKQDWMASRRDPIDRVRQQPLYVAYDIQLQGQTSFRVLGKDGVRLTQEHAIQLRLPGIHNIQNSLAAFVAAHTLGVATASIVHTLEGFGGIRRRFEIRQQGTLVLGDKTIDDVTVIDDYAHHPTAIAATLEATRQRYPGHRLIAVYQPHMYSRTKTFFDQFLLSFDAADVVLIADIFPARERDTGLISARDLVKAIAHRPHFQGGQSFVLHSGSLEETTAMLQQMLKTNDIVIIMGAGDIYTVTERLLRQQESVGLMSKERIPDRIFEATTAYDELHALFGDRVRRSEPLARHCTFGVGGPADVWVSLDTQNALIELVTVCAQQRWPLLLVGNGTNVLFADAGVRGIVARIAFNSYQIEEQGNETALLVAGAGVSWPRLLNELAALGWGGLEFGPGIPGTLGGGVISNAGAHNSDLAQVLQWVEVLDVRNNESYAGTPTIIRYTHDEIDLGYRHSRFRAERRVQFDEQGYPLAAPRTLIEPAEIIMQLGILLHRESSQQLRETIEAHKQHRKRTQPPQQSAGSVFKNPAGDSAGRLIEAAGLKGARHGNAQISDRHANFIVNVGGASAADVAALIQEAHNRVKARFAVELELEVELRGDFLADGLTEGSAAARWPSE